MLSHNPLPNPRGRVAGRTARDDDGYVLVMFAMLLVPILLVSGLSVDVGSWYNRVSQIRKAADAAALAGVVWLPNVGNATLAAEAAATRNGFTNGDDGGNITVKVERVRERVLAVTITDKSVGSFFYENITGREIELSRTSYAEYQLPVPLGSPRNYFGTGPLVPAPNTELLFQSINPYCTSKVQGDRHQSRYFSQPPTHCSGTTSTEYRAGGYELFIEAPEGAPAPIEVLLYDPRYNSAPINPLVRAVDEKWGQGSYPSGYACPDGGTLYYSGGSSGYYHCRYGTARRYNGPIGYWRNSTEGWVMQESDLTPFATRFRPLVPSGPDSYLANTDEEDYTFELWSENSPFTDADDARVCGPTTYTRSSAFQRTYLGSVRWNVLCTVTPSATGGRYILKARNEGGGGSGDGSNQWGVVAKYTNNAGNLGNGLCDGRTYGQCPRVYGKEAISVYANTTAGTAQFFLAEIEPVHSGKKLILELWDPGEGGSSLRILQPTGSDSWGRTDMTWRSYVNESSTVDESGSGQSIDVTGDIFNGRKLVIEIDLAGYNPPSDNKWWKIEYEFNNPDRPNVTDRTTWTARIIGDPVHLIEEF